jgi:GTP-binding protein
MIIRSATFIKSSTLLKECPPPEIPEFGFIGRSNVGKSTLINMLTGWGKLARTSAEPGKTRTINHFLINGQWYLVDLPGYGYAKVSKKERSQWGEKTTEYLLGRENLTCLFVLLDSRLEPQKSDLEFLEFAGKSGIPLARVFTKSDKITAARLKENLLLHDTAMLEGWESLPASFISSSVSKAGREDILTYIEETINNLPNASADNKY